MSASFGNALRSPLSAAEALCAVPDEGKAEAMSDDSKAGAGAGNSNSNSNSGGPMDQSSINTGPAVGAGVSSADAPLAKGGLEHKRRTDRADAGQPVMDLRSDSNSNSANVAPVVETKSSPNSPLNASAVVMEAELVGEKKSDHQPGRKGKGKKGKKRRRSEHSDDEPEKQQRVGDDNKNPAKAKARQKVDAINTAGVGFIQESYDKFVSAKPGDFPELNFGANFTSRQLATFLQRREALSKAWGKPAAESPYVTVCLLCPPGRSDSLPPLQ
jgi:hypothetical protein